MSPTFLKGKKVALRPPLESDLNQLMVWINDPDVRQFIGNFWPKGEEDERSWLRSATQKDNSFALIIEADGQAIGTMGAHRIEWVHRVCTTGALIGDKNFWGRGFGKDAKMALLEFLFDSLGMNKVCSDVIEYNTRSLRYSQACGYVIEGRRSQQIFRHGKFWDLIELGLLRDQWLPIRDKYQKTAWPF